MRSALRLLHERTRCVADRITTLAIPREFAAWSKNRGKKVSADLPLKNAWPLRLVIHSPAGNPSAAPPTSSKATQTYQQRKRLVTFWRCLTPQVHSLPYRITRSG